MLFTSCYYSYLGTIGSRRTRRPNGASQTLREDKMSCEEMFDGCQNSRRLRACFELTLAPSFPGAPSGPFAPLSPCGREIARSYACGVTEAIMLYDAMTLQQLLKSRVTHPVSLGSWDAASSSLSGHTLQTRGPLSSWST